MCSSAMLTTIGKSCRAGRMSRRLATAMPNRTTDAMAARNADSQNGDMLASSTLLIGQVTPQPSTASARPAIPRVIDGVCATAPGPLPVPITGAYRLGSRPSSIALICSARYFE